MSDVDPEKFVVIREEKDKKEVLKIQLKETEGEAFCYIEKFPDNKKMTLSCEGDIEEIRKILRLSFVQKRLEEI